MSNTTTELSVLAAEVGKHIEAGEFQEASNTLSAGWREDMEFGMRPSTLPDFPDLWVRFATRGYPYSLARKWLDKNSDEMLLVMLGYVEEWNMIDLDSNPIALPEKEKRSPDLVDNVEDRILFWLVQQFQEFWQRDLRLPRKNSQPPLSTS